jgi:hypothetical protein
MVFLSSTSRGREVSGRYGGVKTSVAVGGASQPVVDRDAEAAFGDRRHGDARPGRHVRAVKRGEQGGGGFGEVARGGEVVVSGYGAESDQPFVRCG